jgi:hypothetical protein
VRDYFDPVWPLINLLAASAAFRSLAFDLDRCLRKYKTNNPKFVAILNERSKAGDVTHAPRVATTSAWRCGTRRIAPRHHEGLRLWLGEMKEEKEGEAEEEEEEGGPLNSGGPASAMPAPWPKRQAEERLCESGSE